MILIIAILAGATLVDSVLSYVGGRILLPAMGLTAPHFWTWFWFNFIVLCFGIVARIVKEVLDS